MSELLSSDQKVSEEQALVYLLEAIQDAKNRQHPDWGTPNWCSKCSPLGLGYCRCEIACNE